MKLFDLFSLNGQVALVTGGGRGIGKFIATGLAEAGANLVLTSRKMKNLADTAEQLEKDYGIKVLPVACDVSNPADIETMVSAAKERFSHIDILVNNAGVTWGSPTLDYPLDKWDYQFNVNVRGVWVLTQKIAKLMKEQGGGSIINLSSVMAFRGSEEEAHPALPYNSTKAAINALTMNLAVKLARYNIRVNSIAPGFFSTDMTAYMEKADFSKEYEAIRQSIPLHCFGGVDDMKAVAVFLASKASSYITGHILVVDGGMLAK